jgi:hypothetical protein
MRREKVSKPAQKRKIADNVHGVQDCTVPNVRDEERAQAMQNQKVSAAVLQQRVPGRRDVHRQAGFVQKMRQGFLL